MIDATQVVRAAQDAFRWCQRHPWRVLFGVLVVLVVRRWWIGNSTPSPVPAVAIADANINEQQAAYLTKKPLPKDYLLTKAESARLGEYRECHQILMGEMAKFAEWELLEVRDDFTTRTPRGPTVVIGLVVKTKHAKGSGKWIVWDQTWFFRGGKMVADFDTSEFGKQGAMVWCFQQEEIQRVYGYAPPMYDVESPADRKARIEESMDQTDAELREAFRRAKAVADEAARNMGIEPAQPLP